MDSRKVSLFATIAAIALVAVGIGFAYTAMTTNSGSNASPEYITIVQGGTGAYQFSVDDRVYWNTDDYKVLTTSDPFYDEGEIDVGDMITVFTLTTGTTTITLPDTKVYKATQLGSSFDVMFAPNAGGSSISGLTCEVLTTTGFTKQTNGTEIFLKIDIDGESSQYMLLTADNTFSTYVTSSWSGPAKFNVVTNGASAYKTATVSVYYGYLNSSNGIAVEHAAGAQPSSGAPANKPINSANLKFKVDTQTQNDTAPTAVTATPNVMAIVVGGDDVTSTIAVTPSTASKAMIVVSSDTTVATVTYNPTTGVVTVHGVAAGTATITVTPVDGSATPASIAVTVSNE